MAAQHGPVPVLSRANQIIMPDGKTHYKLWKQWFPLAMAGSVAAGVGTTVLTGDIVVALKVTVASAAGYVVGSVVTPDADLITIDRGEALAIKSIVFLPIIAWSTAYAKIMQAFGGHRSLWSHLPVFSTLLRMCWFALPLVLIMYWAGLVPGVDYSAYFIGLWLGLSISDAVHSGADYLSSKRKRTKKKWRIR